MWNEKCSLARKVFSRKDFRGRSKEEGVRRNDQAREIFEEGVLEEGGRSKEEGEMTKREEILKGRDIG